MLRKLTLRNFKRFGANRAEFRFAPITLVFGPNSAGKSGIFQSLLALRQSWTLPHRIVRLNTCGSSVDLGPFGGVVHRQPSGAEAIEIELGIEVEDPTGSSTAPRRAYFAYGGARDDINGSLRRMSIGDAALNEPLSSEFAVAASSEGSREVTFACRIDQTDLDACPGDLHRAFFRLVEELGLPPGRIGARVDVTVKPDETDYAVVLDVPRIEYRQEDSLSQDVHYLDAWEDPAWVARYPANAQAEWRGREEQLAERVKVEAKRLFNQHFFVVRAQLRQIGHIGRLRLPTGLISQRPVRLLDDMRVGGDGENLGPILLERGDLRALVNDVLESITAPEGGSPAFPHYSVQARLFGKQLGAAGEVWLNHHNRAGEIIASVPIDGVGTGVGQVLPVVTEWLRIRLAAKHEGTGMVGDEQGPTTLMIVEQPELHLHPAQQAALMTVLAGIDPGRLVPWGKPSANPVLNERAARWQGLGPCQIILETHSEHMILRLKNHVRRGDISHRDISILVLDSYEHGAAFVEHVELNERGEFSRPWPNGFFPERLRRLGPASEEA